MRQILCLICFLWILPSWGTPTQWQSLAPGFDYASIAYKIPYSSSKLHAFRIDPKRYQFLSVTAKDLKRKAGLALSFARAHNAFLAVNGGFFDSDYQPMGLRISQTKTISPLKTISWWGIFYLRNNKPAIILPDTYQADSAIQFAIQSGPRLLINGKIPSLKGGSANRSAICITHDNQVIIAVTEQLPLTTIALAHILKAPEITGGFDCKDALNLDGGRSSQLYARVGKKTISVPNLRLVADAIIIKPN